ncbi:unnamed protein product [Paramecium primaurelia]|uniref:Uncharacterized protein n=1 Tax=Paramecium primaurelia TaxID=5886 RepID=A0A8S1N0D5_PARPR|nr:unnamed protein product [Paramecium primaurelia]
MKDWQLWAENQQILNPEELPPLHSQGSKKQECFQIVQA